MLRQLATAHPELYGSLFHKTFQNYPVPTFALCGHIELSLAEVLDADVGFGFARYGNPYPNLFFFHGKATIAKVIDAEINAEFTTEGYVHFDAAVKGGYPTKDPWINWDIGLDFEYFKKQFNAEAHAVHRDRAAGLHDRRQRPRVQQGPRRLPVLQDVRRHVAAGRRRDVGPRPDAVPVRLRRQGLQGRHQARALRRHRDRRHRPGRSIGSASQAGTPVVDAMPTGGHGNSAGLVKLAGKASASQSRPRPRRPGPTRSTSRPACPAR